MPTFNTTDPKPGYVYDSATDTWFPLVGIAPGSSVVRWRKTAEGGETSFTGLDDLGATLSYNAGTEQVYLNGVLLVRTEDYTATNGTSVTALNALAASDVIEVISFNATNVQITDALLETDINAKGDLIVGAGVDTAAILASGTNGQVLKVNTATTSGLEWGSIDADIEGVTAGTGISGGGTSGTVTITNSMATAIDAKGDLIAGTGADAFAKLSVGTNGQVLTAASGETTGLSWATPSSAGVWTQVATGSMTGASVNITGLSGRNLYLFLDGVSSTGSMGNFRLRVNNDSNAIYFSSAQLGETGSGGNTFITINNSTADPNTYSGAWLFSMSDTSMPIKPILTPTHAQAVTAPSGYVRTSSAITQINLFGNTGSWDAGTYWVWSQS
jgi:hypothetical protein